MAAADERSRWGFKRSRSSHAARRTPRVWAPSRRTAAGWGGGDAGRAASARARRQVSSIFRAIRGKTTKSSRPRRPCRRPTQPQFAGVTKAPEPRKTLLQSRAASEEALSSLNTALGARYTPLPAWDQVPGCATTEETPPGGAAVFENSTACAPIGCGFAPWPLICASRFVNADGALCVVRHLN